MEAVIGIALDALSAVKVMDSKSVSGSGVAPYMLLGLGSFLIDMDRPVISEEYAQEDMPDNILKSYWNKNKVLVTDEYGEPILDDKGKKQYYYEYVLNDKAYNEIKAQIFNVFKESFVGTDGDNSYTITNSQFGTAISSGEGSDTFNLKGDLVNAHEYNNKEYKDTLIDEDTGKKKTYVEKEQWMLENHQNYDIVSDFDTDEDGAFIGNDNINITNYSFDKNTLFVNADRIRNYDGDAMFNGLSLELCDYKKNNYATVNYGVGDIYHDNSNVAKMFLEDYGKGVDVTNNKFDNLTITDGSKKTFNVTAEYNGDTENALEYNWTTDEEKGKNHIAVTCSKDTVITSNEGINSITAGSFAKGEDSEEGYAYRASLTYNYNGGNDVVSSTNYYSDDTYNVSGFDKNTKLFISDEGGNDELIVSGDADSARLFFDVDADGWYSRSCSLVTSGNLKKSNFILTKEDYGFEIEYLNGKKVDEEYEIWYDAQADKGIGFGMDSIENVTIGEQNYNSAQLNIIAGQIADEVVNWLNNEDLNKKGYYSASEVLNRGSASEINQVLAIYNDINNYSLPA